MSIKASVALELISYDCRVKIVACHQDERVAEHFSFDGRLGDLPYEKLDAIKDLNIIDGLEVEDGKIEMLVEHEDW